jgi:Rrf2 family protein
VTTFSHTTGYAIEALACLARHGPDSMLVREIVETTEMPLPYLSKVFQRLGDAGIVETKRGYKGGVRLNRAPSEISLLQIDSAVEGQKSGHCSRVEKSTRPNTFWEAFQRSYREKLSAMTLADVLAYETQLRPGK